MSWIKVLLDENELLPSQSQGNNICALIFFMYNMKYCQVMKWYIGIYIYHSRKLYCDDFEDKSYTCECIDSHPMSRIVTGFVIDLHINPSILLQYIHIFQWWILPWYWPSLAPLIIHIPIDIIESTNNPACGCLILLKNFTGNWNQPAREHMQEISDFRYRNVN